MQAFNCTSIIIFALALFGLTGAVNLPAPIAQRRDASSQKAYTCQGWNDYGELTQNGLNGTKCDCAGVSALQTPETIRNITNFSDPAQCTDYVLISARGTLEPEGLSIGFLGMTFGTLEQVPNGAFYAVRYPAGVDQNTTLGVRDVVNSITQGLAACPNRTYALYGASQGATVILRALPEFTQSMFDSVKAIILVGNPFRAPGKRSNVDGFGRRTEKSNTATGVFYGDSDSVELSEQWDQSGKVLDICRDGDGVCDSKQACSGATLTHMTYGISQNVQTLGIRGEILAEIDSEEAEVNASTIQIWQQYYDDIHLADVVVSSGLVVHMHITSVHRRAINASSVPIPRDESPSNSYSCQGFGDYNVSPEGKLNGTKCDCGGTGILQPPTETPRIVTNFSDPTQCTDYALVSARGTLEPDGISSAFIGLTYTTLGQVPNGAFYSVQYPAGVDQNTTLGVQDVVNSLNQGITSCPNRAYVLLGASQGASVIVKAIPLLSEDIFNHVKAVVVVASPYRAPEKKSNVNGRGARTKDSNKAVGVFADMPDAVELPENWDKSGKVLDICLENDGICNWRKACAGLTIGHLSYAISQSVQVLSTGHVIGKLAGRG